jgi:hypothetical protein
VSHSVSHVNHSFNSDLAGIRDKVALAKLPPGERADLTQLWADVAELFKQAQTATTKQVKP